MRIFASTLFAALFFSVPGPTAWAQSSPAQTAPAMPPAIPHLSVCYNKNLPSPLFAPFSILVLDSSYPAEDLKALRESGKTTLCHLSLGMASPAKGWFKPLEEAGVLKESNADSNDKAIDLKDPAWENLLIQALIPQLIEKGFTGLFLDDLDAIQQRRQQGQASALIDSIRKHFPQLKLMANGGLEYLPSFAQRIDYILLENRIANKQQLTPLPQLSQIFQWLDSGIKANPKLLAFALDYYSPEPIPLKAPQLVFIASLRRLHLENGLVSCVTAESLDAVPIRPIN
jgi:hypothetical protein